MTLTRTIVPLAAVLIAGSAAAQDGGNVTIVKPGDAPVTTVSPVEDPDVTVVGEPSVEAVTVRGAEGTPLPGTLFQQSGNTVLASTLMDVDVVNDDGNDIGDVVDLLIYPSGELQGVLMEVGGFLGIGEKTIAVDFQHLQITRDEDGDFVVLLRATENEVDAAPEFVTLEDAEEVAAERAEELAEERAEEAEAQLQRRAERLEERADELQERAEEVEERTEERVRQRAEERIEERIVR